MSGNGWHNCRALVTGASSGIGAAISEQLAREGARLLLTGRNSDALDQVADRCDSSPTCLAGDLTEPDHRHRLAQHVTDVLGGLDLLVNNAGISMNARFQELELQVMRRIFEINFFAAAELTQLVLRPLIETRGRIIVVSSLTGLVGTPTRTAYAASKHALHGLFSGLRVELRSSGVSVTLVCPGYVETPIRVRAVLADGSFQGHDQAAGRRMLSAEEVARRTLHAAMRRRRTVLMGTETRLARILSIVAPGLLDRILERATR